MRYALPLLMCSSLIILVSGCGADVDVDNDFAPGEVEQASYGQVGCTSASIPDTSPYTNGRIEPMWGDPDCYLEYQTYTSPTGAYSNGSSCTGDYIVEFTGTTGRDFNFEIDYAGTMGESICENGNYHVELSVWKYNGSWSWHGGTKMHSSSWGVFGGCNFAYDPGYSGVPGIISSSYSKFRVVARAQLDTAQFGLLSMPVTTGIRYGGPC